MKILVLLFTFFFHVFSFAQSNSEIMLEGDIELNDFIAKNLRLPARAELENQHDSLRVTVYCEKNIQPTIKDIAGYSHWDFAAEIVLLVQKMPAIKKNNGYVSFDVVFSKNTKAQNRLSNKEYKQFQKRFIPYSKDLYLAHYQNACGQTLSEYYIPYCLEQNFKLHPEQDYVRLLARCDGYSQPENVRPYEFENNECTNMLLQAYQLALPELADQMLKHKEIMLLWRRRSGPMWSGHKWFVSYGIPQQYIGGEEALNAFIQENLVYPVTAFREKREGECIIGFCYDQSFGKDAWPNIRVIKCDHPDFLLASLRCLSKTESFELNKIPSFTFNEDHRKVLPLETDERWMTIPEMIIHFDFDLEKTKTPDLTTLVSGTEPIQPFFGNYYANKPYLISQKPGFDNFIVNWYFSFERIQKINPELLDSKFYLNIYGAIDKYGYFHLDESKTAESTKVHPDFSAFVQLIQNFGPWMPAEFKGEKRSHAVRLSFQNDGVKTLFLDMEYLTHGFGTILPRFIGNKEEMSRYLSSGLSVACEVNDIPGDSILIKFKVGRQGESSEVITSFDSGLVFRNGFREFQNVWTDKQINGDIVNYDTAMCFKLDVRDIVYRNRQKFCPPAGKKFSQYDKIYGNVVIPPQYFGGNAGLYRLFRDNLIWTEKEQLRYEELKNISRNFRITLIIDKNGNTDSVEVTMLKKKSMDIAEFFQNKKNPVVTNVQLEQEYEKVLTDKIRRVFLNAGKWIPGRSKDSRGEFVHSQIEILYKSENFIYVEGTKKNEGLKLEIRSELSKPKPYLMLDFPSSPNASDEYGYSGNQGVAGPGSGSRDDMTIYNYQCEIPASFGSKREDLSIYLNKCIAEYIQLNPSIRLSPFKMTISIDPMGHANFNFTTPLSTFYTNENNNTKLARSIVEKMPSWSPAIRNGKNVTVELDIIIEP